MGVGSSVVIIALFAVVVMAGYYYTTRPRSALRDDNRYERWCNEWVPGGLLVFVVGMGGVTAVMFVGSLP